MKIRLQLLPKTAFDAVNHSILCQASAHVWHEWLCIRLAEVICVRLLPVCGCWWWEVGDCTLWAWCPARFSVQTTAVLTVCCSCKRTPAYLASELHWHQPPRSLRSGTTTTLHWPHASSDFHQHSFAVSAPATWNNIPASIHDSGTLGTFKTALKTQHFTPPARHATDSHPSASPIHAFVTFGANRIYVIDWLIDNILSYSTMVKKTLTPLPPDLHAEPDHRQNLNEWTPRHNKHVLKISLKISYMTFFEILLTRIRNDPTLAKFPTRPTSSFIT